MADLIPITALGGSTAKALRIGALELRENPDLALASLALRRDIAPPEPFGLRLPGPGRACGNAQIGAFWAGPGQWMIEAPGRAEADFAAALAAQCPGCSITEQTDGFVAFEITAVADGGGLAADHIAQTAADAAERRLIDNLLSKLVNIDLGSFGPGAATRTGFEHMSVFVIRRNAGHVAVLAMRSVAASVWHRLCEAAARFDGEIL